MTDAELDDREHAVRAWIFERFRVDLTPKLEILEGAGWVAVPAESASHLDSGDIERLVLVSNSLSERAVDVVVVEPLEQVVQFKQFPATHAGFYAFDQEYSHFCCALVARGRQFAIVYTPYDYVVVVGSPGVACQLVGQDSVPAARAAFTKFARGVGESYLDRIAEACEAT